MLHNKILLLTVYFLVALILGVLSFSYIQNEEKHLLQQKYLTTAHQMKKTTQSLIEDKKNATLAFAISAAKEEKIKEALLTNNASLLDFKAYSQELREQTKFKNVWFQVITDDGKSFYRSWTDKRGDKLTFRLDVQKILKHQTTQASISVGRYDITFKTMVPLFHEDRFLGVFEVITHFNSIAKTLESQEIDTIVLAHKKYKKELLYPFTNRFLDHYYIANLTAKESLVNRVQTQGVESILSLDEYLLLNNKLITTQTIKDEQGLDVGYLILCKDTSSIDINEIISFKKNATFFVLLTLIILGFIFAVIGYYAYFNQIKQLYDNVSMQKEKNQQILDSQHNIIIITDGLHLQEANQQLFEFFSQYNNLEAFKKEHDCICDFFLDMHKENYIIDKDYEGLNWAEHILNHPDKRFKVAMKKDKHIHHFTLHVKLNHFKMDEKPYIIVTLTDITQEIFRQQQLKELNENLETLVNDKTKELKELNETLEVRIQNEIQKNQQKDRMLFQQNKMAAMGEMLKNIAHQWRQPLSAISTAASGIQLQNEFELLDKKSLTDNCTHILKYTEYLSHTIEEFKDFFQQDRIKQSFYIVEALQTTVSLIKETLKAQNIELHFEQNDDFQINSYLNELKQALFNIIQNSIDALSKSEQPRHLFIEINTRQVKIYDNAGGIDETILDNIFDPYFTTKHQSQGTGIGLFMTQEILTKHMKCELLVSNHHFVLANKEHRGALFIIDFPL